MNLKYNLGLWMLRKGTSIVFCDEESKEVFKEKVNAETYFGSYVESGNHIISNMNPIDSYTVQSVINVLRHKEPNYNRVVSNKLAFYKDEWLSEYKHKEKV